MYIIVLSPGHPPPASRVSDELPLHLDLLRAERRELLERPLRQDDVVVLAVLALVQDDRRHRLPLVCETAPSESDDQYITKNNARWGKDGKPELTANLDRMVAVQARPSARTGRELLGGDGNGKLGVADGHATGTCLPIVLDVCGCNNDQGNVREHRSCVLGTGGNIPSPVKV